jgi:hypothetical protein
MFEQNSLCEIGSQVRREKMDVVCLLAVWLQDSGSTPFCGEEMTLKDRYRTESGQLVIGLAIAALSAVPVRAADPYTFIVVPDTQNYTDFVNENNVYNKGQMNWIVANRTAMDIKFVMHLGDHQNPGNPYRTRADDIYEPDLSRPLGDVNDKLAKWGRADAATDILDAGGVPYSLVPGNHDYLDHDSKTEPYMYLKTFGPSRYINNPKFDEKGNKTYGGSSPATSTFAWAGMNTYHRVYAGGYTWLNIALQDEPDNNDLAWAQQIINQNPNMPTIMTTHEFVNTTGAANDYQHPDIFNKFVKNNPQVVMTFNGHLTGEARVNGTNIAGRAVQQMLVDYQSAQFDDEFGGNYYKGAGILRTVQVDPDANLVRVKSYSPIANQYLTGSDSQFNFTLNLKDRFGLADKAGTTGSVTFRHGLNGYSGTRDSIISEANPDTNYGEDPGVVISNDFGGATSQGVIRFDGIFGAGVIPDGAQVDKAELRIHTSDQAAAQSTNTIRLYRLLTGWTEPNITWDSMTGGFSTNGLEAILGENGALVPSMQDGYITFDVTESLAAWATGAPNNGWVLVTNGNDNWRWDTSEASDGADRPQLHVNYRTTLIPEPAGMVAIIAFGGLSLARQRRHRGIL